LARRIEFSSPACRVELFDLTDVVFAFAVTFVAVVCSGSFVSADDEVEGRLAVLLDELAVLLDELAVLLDCLAVVFAGVFLFFRGAILL
jgi:hypothetical protein